MIDAPGTVIVCVGHGTLYRWGLPAVLVAGDATPVTPPELGQAEAIVAALDADGRLVFTGLAPAVAEAGR